MELGQPQEAPRVERRMSSTYEVVLLHRGLEDFADEIEEAVRDATGAILLQPDLVQFTDDLAAVNPASHVAVVYLGNQSGAQDANLDEVLADALTAQIPVLPLMRDSEPGKVSEKLPPSIRRVNAADWHEARGLAIATLLRMLGLGEPERKVFLSYFQRESTPIAVQLHTRLAQAQFEVFLDRFAVPPGDDFQRRLDEDLGDKAFVLLIESPGLRTSHWVEHEIAYAHSHRIGVLAVTLPGTADAQLVPAVDEAFRVRLEPHDLEDGELTPEALLRVLDRVELAHARELRRRREQLLGSLRDKLFMDGCTCEPVAEWAVLATAPGKKSTVFLVTPRRPRADDLYELNVVHAGAIATSGLDLRAAVVHEVEHIDDYQRAVLAWIGEPREFEAMLLHGCVLDEDPAA